MIAKKSKISILIPVAVMWNSFIKFVYLINLTKMIGMVSLRAPNFSLNVSEF